MLDGAAQARLDPLEGHWSNCVADHSKGLKGLSPQPVQSVRPGDLDVVPESFEEDSGSPNAVLAGVVDLEAELRIVIEQPDAQNRDSRG